MERDNIISEIEEKDLTQLKQIQQEVFNSKTNYDKVKELFRESKNNKDIHVLGYYIKDNLVGTLTLNILTLLSGKEATIWDLAIKEDYRRLGIAIKLMNKAEEKAKEIFRDNNYYYLINGYKNLFIDKNNGEKQYKESATLEEIFALYKFDSELKSIFLKYILKIERRMDTYIAYEFFTSFR